MKKILALLLVLSINSSAFAASYMDKQFKEVKKNEKYNSVQKHKRNYDYTDNYLKKSTSELKDPKLIKLTNFTPVDKNLYEQKLAKDELIYEKTIKPIIDKKMNSVNIQPASVDFYTLYRISERLIRANNLGYMNWRISLRKSDTINAYADEINSISINTALFDSLYNNPDALAMVIAHEMSHQILNHQQRLTELYNKLDYMIDANSTYNKLDPLGTATVTAADLYQLKRVFNEIKMMEFMADAEAFNLLIRAGYSPSKSLEALNFLDVAPQLRAFLRTHPLGHERLASAKENIYFANPDWIEEGKANIYNSDVLNCKKSSDKISIVIEKADKINNYYEVETPIKRLTRVAYVSYMKDDMKNAEKYFSKLANKSNDYVVYLYLSYTNERLFSQTKNDKYLKQAVKNAEKSLSLQPNNKNAKKQLDDLKSL